MKKALLINILSLLFITVSFSQSIEWAKCYGGTGLEDGAQIQQTTEGGYVFIGYTESTDGDVADIQGAYDYWVVKLDNMGSIEWQKCLGGSDYEYGKSIHQTFDKGFIVSGRSRSNDGDVTVNKGDYDCWIVKLDLNGNIEWQKSFGGNGVDFALSIKQTTDSGYIFAASTSSVNMDVSGNHGMEDCWIVKLDNAGNIQWRWCYGGTGSDQVASIIQSIDGGFIFTGFSLSNNGDVTGNHGGNDIWVVKLDSIGILEWQKCYGGSAWEQPFSIKQTTDLGYIVSGLSYSSDGDVSNNNGSSDSWILKIDSIGIIQWEVALGGSNEEWGTSVVEDTNGNYLVAGRTMSQDGHVSYNNGNCDYWITKLDNSGNLIWEKSFGGSFGEWANCINNTDDGGFIIAGSAGSNNGDITGNHGYMDIWVVKIDPVITSSNYFTKHDEIAILPNPTNGVFKVEIDKFEKIEILNMNGEKILESFDNSIDICSQPSGFYIINILTGIETISEIMIKN